MIARLCFALAAGLAFAQSPPRLEIRGTVVEGGLGVAAATVTLYQFGADAAHATTRTAIATTSTDAKGDFQLRPPRAGEYYVEANKEGYFAESFDGPAADPMDRTGDAVSIDPDHPSQDRRFSLIRLGEIHGRVIDEDGNPMAKLHIGLRPATSTQVVTDQDGYFAATKLRPRDYLVGIGPQRGGVEIQPEFSESDLKAVDQDLEISFWPGGGDERAASPLRVSAGASLDVGTITARMATYYRAHLSVLSADCAPGEKWTFMITPETTGLSQAVPCGKEFLVRHLAPGSYTFAFLLGGRPGDKRERAAASVEVKGHNVEAAMTMSPGTDITGRIVGAEGVTVPPLVKTMVMVASVSGRLSIGGTPADPAGNFRIFGIPGERSRIVLFGLDTKFYVKELRYNGVIVPDGIFTQIAGSPTVLEVVVDDHGATISGSVAGRDKRADRVTVVALKWPVLPEVSSIPNLLMVSATGVADDQGRFQIGGLAPGEYRVFAVTQDAMVSLKPDDSVARFLSTAEEVTLERGSSKDISLKLVEP